MQKQDKEQWIADPNQLQQPKIDLNIVKKEEQIEQASQKIIDSSIRLSHYESQTQTPQNICIQDNSVSVISFLGKKMDLLGQLKVTNLRVVFTAQMDQFPFFEFPIGYLSKCQKIVEQKNNSCIQLTLKYGLSIKLKYLQTKLQITTKTVKIVNHLIQNIFQLALEFSNTHSNQLKYQVYNPVFNDKVQQACLYDNKGSKLLPGYPLKLKVPLPYLSKNSPQQRVIFLSFTYDNCHQQLSFWRNGPGKIDPTQQQWLMKGKNNPKLYTVQIKNKGIGNSRSQALRVIQSQGPTQVRQSLTNMLRICCHNHQSLKWILQVSQCRWLDQIYQLIHQSSALVMRLINNSANITLLSDTDLRGAQISSIVQVMLHPQARTIIGFGNLVQKQFLSWGNKPQKKQLQIDRAAYFIQFLDAIHQLISIYPLSFQFSQYFLVFLAQQVYSARFSNFFVMSRINMKQQEKNSLEKCLCIWKFIQKNLKDNVWASQIFNPFYVQSKQCDIYQLQKPPYFKQMKIWFGFFMKKFRQNNSDYQIFLRHIDLSVKYFNNKFQTDSYRKQLSSLRKLVLQKKSILNDLKALQ